MTPAESGRGVVRPSRGPVYRVGRRSGRPFAPPDWLYADPDDGTFSGRFDDPRGRDGLPERERFRVIYTAATPTACFGETLGGSRPGIPERLAAVAGNETVLMALAGAVDPVDPRRRLVTSEWRASRRLDRTHLPMGLAFLDIEDPDVIQALAPELEPVAARLGIPAIDLGAVFGSARQLTQEAARVIHALRPAGDHAGYAGIRYVSRFNRDWECLALFTDRIGSIPATSCVREEIRADASGLLEAAALLRLTIVGDDGALIRPAPGLAF